MAESRTGPKFGHPTLFLFLAYFSFTSPFLLDLYDAFTTCYMTNTTVTPDLAPPPPPQSWAEAPPKDGKKRGKKI